eukprot:Awhi_evm1s9645
MKSIISIIVAATLFSSSYALRARAGLKGPTDRGFFDENGRSPDTLLDYQGIGPRGLDAFGRAISNPDAGNEAPAPGANDTMGTPDDELDTTSSTPTPTIPLPLFGTGGASVDTSLDLPDYDEYLDDDDYYAAETETVYTSQTITEEIFAAVVSTRLDTAGIGLTLAGIAVCSGVSPLDINFFAFQYEFRGTIVFAGGDAPTVEAIQYASINDPECFQRISVIGFEFGDDSIMTACAANGEYLSDGQCK